MENTEPPVTAILLVDDDTTFLSILARSMSKYGYSVLVASTTAQAMALCQQHRPGKAVVDLKLENESGLQLIPELKTCHPAMEILVLTGYSSISTAVEAIKLGAVNYLCKPAGTAEILSAFDSESTCQANSLPENRPSVNRLEWEHIHKVLTENGGNVSATARSLGMHRRTLQRKLQKRPTKL